MATLGNRKNTADIIERHRFDFRKKFGQNFLIDNNILEKIIEAAQITKDDCVLEIGPGIGTLTQRLAEEAGEVIAVEIDKNLIPILNETLADYDNVTIINDDILKVDINKAAQTDEVADTVNYAEVHQVIMAEMAVPSKLLEHVGGRIIEKLFQQFPALEEIELHLSKRNPPMGADVESAGIELHCSRK